VLAVQPPELHCAQPTTSSGWDVWRRRTSAEARRLISRHASTRAAAAGPTPSIATRSSAHTRHRPSGMGCSARIAAALAEDCWPIITPRRPSSVRLSARPESSISLAPDSQPGSLGVTALRSMVDLPDRR
jgi:hypothetical protein